MKKSDINQIIKDLGFRVIDVQSLSFDSKGIDVEVKVKGSENTGFYRLPYSLESSSGSNIAPTSFTFYVTDGA